MCTTHTGSNQKNSVIENIIYYLLYEIKTFLSTYNNSVLEKINIINLIIIYENQIIKI